MISFPHSKINLGLRVIRKRPDGYHDIETVFYPLPFCDALEILRSDPGQTTCTLSGMKIPVDKENNLCLKAWLLLKNDFPGLPEVSIHLHKVIPAGAGLGGGSSDAAFTLKMLNSKFSLGLDESALTFYALQLGSDCPFFIQTGAVYATGRGEKMEPVQPGLGSYQALLVNPGIHVSTAAAFSDVRLAGTRSDLKEIISQPVDHWRTSLVNDFEITVFKSHPELAVIKEKLYAAGAVYASLSGTGSTVYGIFKKDQLPQLDLPENYFIKKLFFS